MGQSSNLSAVKENHCVGPNAHESSPQGAEDVQNGNSHSQGAEEYNRLLNQYYELEEKRQKILEQLHQFGSWNYQYSGEGSGYGTYQEHLLPANQACNPNVVCSCCPYACQGSVTSCSSAPACCLGGPYACNSCPGASVVTDPGRSLPLEDSDIVKTAMGAAERAISSMTMKISGDSNADEGTRFLSRVRDLYGDSLSYEAALKWLSDQKVVQSCLSTFCANKFNQFRYPY